MSRAGRNPLIRPLVKFTIYALVCVVLLGYLTVQVGNIKTLPFVSHDHTYFAQLADASSLVPPDDVKIAGVTVGQVKGVSVQHGHAVVRFVVDSKIKLRASTQVGMRFQNVIGAKYLYLYPGSSGDVMRAGSTFDLTHDVGGADVGDFLTDIGAFLKALNPSDVNAFTQALVAALQGNDSQVSQLFASTAAVSGTLGGLDTHVASVIDNLQRVLSALAARNADLASVTDHLASASQQLAAHNDVLDNVVTDFGQVNGQLQQLLSTNRGNLDQTIANLQTIANVLAQHHGDLNNDLTTLSAGLEPYTLISSYGQWFQIRLVYTCLAAQTTCQYEDPSHPPQNLSGAAPSPSPAPTAASAPGLDAVTGFALYGRAGG